MEDLKPTRAELEAQRIAAIRAKLLPLPASPPPSSPWKKIAVFVILVVLLFCLAETTLVISLSKKVILAKRDAPAALAVVAQYMHLMQYNNPEDAYDLFSQNQQHFTHLEDLKNLLRGEQYQFFEGYRSVNILDFSLLNRQENPDWVTRRIADLIYEVEYEDGAFYVWEALLEKENGEWRLINAYPLALPNERLRDA